MPKGLQGFQPGHTISKKYLIDYKIDPVTGCWGWLLCINKQWGYAYLNVKGKSVRAARYYYKQYKGEIPDGLVIDHLCRNRACVNPDHLEAVTTAVNNQRRITTKLTRQDVDRIKELYGTGNYSQRGLGRLFGVSYTAIRNITSGKGWK